MSSLLSSSSIASFTFRTVDDRSFPYLRGVGTFFDLFDERTCKAVNLSGVCAVSGHFAVLFHDFAVLCVFDAVPSNFRLSDVSSRLLVDILTKRKTLSVNNLTDILVSTHTSPLVRVFFDKGPPLRLVAVQADGTCFVWDWLVNEWTWKPSCKFNINQTASSSTINKIIKDAGFNFGVDREFVLWLDSANNLYARNLQLPKIDVTSKKRMEDSQLQPTLQPSTLVGNIPDPNCEMLLGKGGVWIYSSKLLYFYSFRSQKLVTINFGETKVDDELSPSPTVNNTNDFSNDNPPTLTEITAATLHPDTQELLLLDPRNLIFACPPDKYTLAYVCALNTASSPSASPITSPSSSPTHESAKIPSKPIHIFAKHHLLFYLQENSFIVYDLQSGSQLATPSLPSSEYEFREWDLSPGFLGISSGVWSVGGIWELKAPPALKQAEMLTNHTTQQRTVEYVNDLPVYTEIQTGGAAPVCHDWGLDKWEAKYLLDTTLTTKSESIKREASKQLLPKLENPALVMALLSSTQSDEFILQELRSFLDKYHGQGSDIERERAKGAFLYHSPLNEKLAPLLDKFYKVAIDSHLPPKEIPPSLHHLLGSLSSNELLKQDAITWELVARAFPDLFLMKLEEVLGLSKIEEYAKSGIASVPPNMAIHRAVFEPEEGLPLAHPSPTSHPHTPQSSTPDLSSPISVATSGPGGSSSSTTRKSTVFDMMVKLYYTYKPQMLPFFIQLVTRVYERNSSASTSTRSWGESASKPPEFFARALLALPPLPDGDISDAQLTCRFEILCASENLADGVRLLLDYDRWDQALAFAKQRMDHDIDHFVLFQILLTHALKARSPPRLNQIWDVMPHGFAIFDLLALIRNMLVEREAEDGVASGKVLADEDEEILMVEVFRPQLLRMWSASKNRESV